jgi:putative aldouronate transport system substrate-binding protein
MAQSYRKDWADALDIEEPTTVEEYTAMLRAFMEEDPGNLGGVLIPFVPNRLDNVGWLGQIIFTAFGCNYGTWQLDPEDETRIVMGASVPACKDALNYFRGLLDDGLLDETWGVSTERGLFKFYAGIAGSTTDWPQFSHLRLEAIQNAFPDIDPAIAYITHMEGPTGIVGGPLFTPQTKAGGAAVTVAATEEEVDAFFRLLEWQYTDGYELMTLGVEGITFDVGEDDIKRRRGRDAVLENNPEYDLYMLDRVFFAEPPKYFGYTRDNPAWNDVSDEMFEYVKGVLEEIEEYKVINYGVNMDHDAIREYSGPVYDIVGEFFTSAILSPGFDMDAEWENYISQLEQAGLPAMTDAVNELNDIDEINAMVGR